MRVKKRSLELLNFFFFACFALETNIKVQAESFHLNGHIIGLRLQTQYILNNYWPKVKLILLNNPQDEVEGIIHKLYHPVPTPSPSKVRWSVTSNEIPGELSYKNRISPHLKLNM